MNDSKKAKVCLQRIVELFKQGNIPKALAVATKEKEVVQH